MANVERWGTRDLSYSTWHRTINPKLSYIDIDGVEYCIFCKKPIALIELAQDIGQTFKPTTVMVNLAKMAGLPAYLVYYAKDANNLLLGFRVTQLSPEKLAERHLTPAEYEDFLCTLRDKHPCTLWNNIRGLNRLVKPQL